MELWPLFPLGPLFNNHLIIGGVSFSFQMLSMYCATLWFYFPLTSLALMWRIKCQKENLFETPGVLLKTLVKISWGTFMTTSTLLAMWLHKSTIAGTSAFNCKLKLPKDLFSRYGGDISAGHSSLCIQSSLSVQPFSFYSFLFSDFFGELKNFAEFFLILLIMFCTKQSHCLTQLFKNVKLTLYSKKDGIFVH